MNKNWRILLTLLLALSLVLTACSNTQSQTQTESGSSAQQEKTTAKQAETTAADAVGGDVSLIVRLNGDPLGFNPNTTADDNGYGIFQNLFNRLVKLDASKSIIPDLATDWSVSEDGLNITFNLRENAKWTDGEPVTSKDVKYTFKTIRDNSSYVMSARLQIIESITTPDEHTVVFNLTEPDVSLISELGWYACFVLPEHIFNNGEAWEDNAASKNPIGSGPYKLGEYKQGQSITLVPNEDYHEGAPKIDQLIFSIIPDNATAVQAFLNGEIDVLDNVPTASITTIEANPSSRMMLNIYPSPMRIVFNLNDDKVSDVAVREAIALAINRDEISKKVFAGVQPPEYSMYPSVVKWAANTTDVTPSFNIEAAIKRLEDAGYTKDADGYYVRGLTIEVFEDGNYPDAAKLMQATLKEAGIELTPNISEFNAWVEKVFTSKDFTMELQGGFMGPDPAALKTRYHSTAGMNLSGYNNPAFDALVDQGGMTGDPAKRAEYYKDAQKILSEDLPFIPIVGYAAYDANATTFINLPIDGEGKWGWHEYTFTERVE